MAAVTSKMSQILTREPAEDELDATDAPRRKHSIDRPSRAAKPAPGPRWQAGQARTAVTLAPRPAAGHGDHRTRGRASPPAASRAAGRSAPGTAGRAAAAAPHAFDA